MCYSEENGLKQFILPASSLADKSGVKTLIAAREFGFGGVELWGDGLLFLSEGEIHEATETFRSYTPEFISVHLPVMDTNIASANREIRRASLESTIKAMAIARRYGAKLAVLHTGKASYGNKVASFKEISREASLDSIYRLWQIAGKLGMTLAVENGGRRDLFSKQDEYLWLTEKALDVPLKKCIDVGHAAVRGWDLEMLASFTDVACVHVHDNDLKHDRHMIPGYGDIPWDSLLPLLRGKPLVLEIREYKTLDDFLEAALWLSEKLRQVE